MIEGLHIHDWIAYKRRIEGLQLIVEHPLCEAGPRGWLVSGEQIPNRFSMREVTKKASCDNKEFLLQYQSFKRARTVMLAYQCSNPWLTSHLFFIPIPGLSLKPTSFPSILPINTSFLPITTPIITTMQAARLLDVRFKVDDSDSDHHGHRTHTSV